MIQESLSKDQLFFGHVHSVASHIRRTYPNVTCIVWDDMFRFSELPVILGRLGLSVFFFNIVRISVYLLV